MAQSEQKSGCFRVGLRWTLRISAALALVLVIAFVAVFHAPLYNRFYQFPREAKAWEEIRLHRIPVSVNSGWNEYRGMMHAHSELSHDSNVPFPEILDTLKKVDADFIFMTDHMDEGKSDYSRGWKGLHDGVLFVRGYEMHAGFMPWGLPDETVLNKNEDPPLLAKRIKDLGGVVFFAHCEEERPWEIPEIAGMEIFNIHSALKEKIDPKKTWELINLGGNLLFSLGSYPDQTFRLVFTRPAANLKRWDDMNQTRKFTGIAANDTHQNTGVIGFYTAQNTLLIRDTGHKDRKMAELHLNFLTRPLVRLFLGPLTPDRQLFRFDLDPYERSARFVNTHLLARELSEPALLDALRESRAFVAFDMIASARGFMFWAEGKQAKAIMGESIPLEPGLKLKAASPSACRFTVVRDGTPGKQFTGVAFEQEMSEAGKYRLEAELDILGEWTPWVYTNNISVTSN